MSASYKTTIPVRFREDHFIKEKALAECKRSGAERLALTLGRELDWRFSSPEKLAKLRYHIEYFKSHGFEVMVWLGETVGHDADRPLPGLPYRNMRYLGKGDCAPFCMLDPVFRGAVSDWVKDVASCGADMIMLDDDFRLGGRSDALPCCCPLHLAAMEKELGEPFTEDDLRTKVYAGGKSRHRDAWMKVCGDAKRGFAKALRDALDTVDPDARLGFCAAPCAWDFDGADAVEIARVLAGGTKPFLRLSGAPYWSGRSTTGLADAIEYERIQADWCKDSGIEIFSEGDTYPRPRFTTPAAYLECFDMILRASGGTDGVLKYMLDYVSHADYETGYIDRHVQDQPLYRQIDELFADKTAAGVRLYTAMRLFSERQINPCDPSESWRMQDGLKNPAVRLTARCSLPTTFEPGYPVVLFGEHARHIPSDELKSGAILDLPAAKLLTERGIDVGFVSAKERPVYQKTGLADQPKEYFPGENQYTLMMQYRFPDVTWKEGVRTVTTFRQGGAEFGGVCEYENADGLKFVLLPFDAQNPPQGFFENYARRRQIVRSLVWMTGKEPIVDLDGSYPMLYPLLKIGGGKAAFGLWNLFPDRIDGLRLKLGAPVKDVRYVNCKGHIEADRIVLDTPLYPYEFAGIELTL